MNKPSDEDLRSLLHRTNFNIFIGHITGVLLAVQTLGILGVGAIGTGVFVSLLLLWMAWTVARNQDIARRCKHELNGDS